MAFNAGTVKATLDLKVQQFRKSVGVAVKGFKSMGKAARTASGHVRKMGSGFKGNIAKLAAGVVSIYAAKKAFDALINTLGNASKAQQEYEQSVQSLAAGLVQSGAPSIKKTTEELEALATTIQDTTRFNDTDVLQVAKSLAAFGDEAGKLKEHTVAVLNFSEAFGTNFTTSARAFGQALAGNAATLARYFPQARELTQEQLKAGAAFDLAAGSLENYAQIAGQTTAGAVARLGNVLNDLQKRLGEAINMFLGPMAEGLKDIFREYVNSLGDGSAAFQSMVETMRTGFELAVTGVRYLIERFYESRIAMGKLQVSGAYLQASLVSTVAVIVEAFVKLGAVISGLAGAIAEWVATIPGLSEGMKQAVLGVADYFREVEKGARAADDEMDSLQQAAIDVVSERKKELKVLEQRLANIKANVKTEDALLNLVTSVYNVELAGSKLSKEERQLRDQKLADERRLADLAQEQNDRIKARLELLRAATKARQEARGSAEATRDATEGIAQAAGSAANNAGQMANAFGRAASSASAAASAAASIGGGAGTRAGESRRSGGSYSLDFSDPFRAVAEAQRAQVALSQTHASAFAGRTQINAARQFADAVGAEAEAAVNQAIGDFTTTILSELNAAGVFDPAQRSRIVRERIQEAERLGIIPQASSLDIMNAGRLG